MKATGVIRRIDNLGRVVIPKEIRKNLRIKSGESLEIYIDENESIILKKHNQIDKLKDIAKELVDSIHNITKNNIIITNTETIISASQKKLVDKELSENIIKQIENRKQIIKEKAKTRVIKNKEETISYGLVPILSNGDIAGSVILIKDQNLNQNDLEILKIVSKFLSNHIEG